MCDDRTLMEISQKILELRNKREFSIDKLVEECSKECKVTFETLQQLKRPENRRKYEGKVLDKELRKRLADALLPRGILNQGCDVYANVDYPEADSLEDERSEEMAERFPGGPISISLFTQEMFQSDSAYWEGGSPLLDAIYAPYSYRFTVGSASASDDSHREQIAALEDYCTFEELCARIEKSSGNRGHWFRAKLFRHKEDAVKNGVGNPLCGEVQFICGKTTIENAYLCITGGKVSSDIVSFYEHDRIDLPGYRLCNTARSNGKGGSSPCSGMLVAAGPGSTPYIIKLYNTGQGNCIYLSPRNTGSQTRFFFDVGSSCYPSNQKGNEKRAEVQKAFQNISTSYPGFIILSHWHRDHYNLIYKFSTLVICPWIVPKIPTKFPKSNTSMLNVLKKNNKLYSLGSVEAGNLVRNSGIVCLEKGNGSGCNNSGILLQMQQTLLPGDCMYKYWPSNWPAKMSANQKFQYLVVPHHGAHISSKSSGNKPLPTQIATALDPAGTVYVCTGENSYGHPTDDHMGALNNHLCGNTGTNASWVTNQRICQTQGSAKPFFEWDDV